MCVRPVTGLRILDCDAVIGTRWLAGLWKAGDYGYYGTEPKQDEFHSHSFRRLLSLSGGESDVGLMQQDVGFAFVTLHLRRNVHEESNAGSHGK